MFKSFVALAVAAGTLFAIELPSDIQASKDPVSGWQLCWITLDRDLFEGGWHKESGFSQTAEKTQRFYTPDSKSCQALADRFQQSRPSELQKKLTSNQGGALPRSAYAKTFTTWQFDDSIINDSSGTVYSRALTANGKRELASLKKRSKVPATLASH